MKKKEKINFLPQNKYYKKISVFIYITSIITIIILYYILSLILPNKNFRTPISALFSFLIGLSIVCKRDKITKKISEIIENRNTIKKENKSGLKTTLTKIVPRTRGLKFNITGKIPIKEKFNKIKEKFTKKSEKKEYIEIDN